MTAERRVLTNTIWLVVQPLLMNVLSLAATAYISRQLGAVEFGRFNLGLAFVALCGPLANLGLRPLSIRHLAQHRDTASEYVGRVLALRTLLGLAGAGLVILAAPLSGGSEGTRSVIVVAALGMVITTAMQVFVDAFQAFERMRPVGLANLAGGLLLTLASVVVIALGGGITHLVVAYSLGPLCSLVLLGLWARRMPFRPRLCWDPLAFTAMLRQASPFLVLIVLEVVSTRVDMVVLARVLGEANLGGYAAAMLLVDRAMVLADGAATALLPALARLSTQSREASEQLLRRSTLWLLVVSLPLALLTAAMAPVAVRLLFGPQFVAAAPILAVGIWRLPAMCLAVLTGHALFAAGRQDLELRTQRVAMALSIALVFPLVSALGPIGGALSLTLRYFLTFLLRLPAGRHHFPRLWPTPELARLAAALALMAVPLAFVPSAGSDLAACALALLSAGIYAACLTLMGILPIHLLLRLGGRLRRERSAGGTGAAASMTGEGEAPAEPLPQVTPA